MNAYELVVASHTPGLPTIVHSGTGRSILASLNGTPTFADPSIADRVLAMLNTEEPDVRAVECQCPANHGVGFTVHKTPCRYARTDEAATDALASFVADHAYAHQKSNNPNAWSCSAWCVASSILRVGLRDHDAALLDETTARAHTAADEFAAEFGHAHPWVAKIRALGDA